jgi:uncharacterized protein (DUF169 family)
METQHSFADFSAELTQALSLKQPPITITFTDSLPSGLGSGSGRVAAGCRFWQDAAEQAFATVAADHNACAIGVHTHNLEPSPVQQTDLMDALKIFGNLGYVRPEDLPQIPVLLSRSKYVIYAPLGETPLPPDVVLMFANANQTLVLSEAVQQVEGGNPPAMGRPACAIVPQVINTGKAAVSLGCCGARAYLDILTDDVALFAFPGATVEGYFNRILALANANQILTRFHQMRRQDIDQGNIPTIQQSFEAFMAS